MKTLSQLPHNWFGHLRRHLQRLAPVEGPIAAQDADTRLTLRFAASMLACILGIAVPAGLLLDDFVEHRLLRQQVDLTHEFVQSLMVVERPMAAYFEDPSGGVRADVEASFTHFAAMPDMLRINVYSLDRTVIWSSHAELIGRYFGPNHELDAALRGQPQTHHELEMVAEHGKDEHSTAPPHSDESFIELYVPVLAPGSQRVLGVIEFYKRPASLLRAKAQLRGYLLWGAGLAGALLFAVLYGQVLRAARTIHRQQAQLVEKETLAAIGEMSSAVAHGLRNPLASIRSSAELIQVGDLPLAREAAGDIVDQTDRLDRWVNELLSYTRPMDARLADVNLTPLLAACEAEFSCELARRKIALDLQIPADLPPVRAHPLLLGQALRSVLANAIEAAGSAGRVAVRASVTLAEADPDAGARPHRSAARVQLVVSDNGPGMSPSELSRVGQPFHTTKPRGLGVGLALARRVLDRFGGNLQIRSRSGVGTEVLLEIPALPLSTPAPR